MKFLGAEVLIESTFTQMSFAVKTAEALCPNNDQCFYLSIIVLLFDSTIQTFNWIYIWSFKCSFHLNIKFTGWMTKCLFLSLWEVTVNVDRKWTFEWFDKDKVSCFYDCLRFSFQTRQILQLTEICMLDSCIKRQHLRLSVWRNVRERLLSHNCYICNRIFFLSNHPIF